MTATLDDEVAELRRANAELQQRLDDALAERDESLERETAAAEVLQVINSSPGDLAPVFDAMLDRALQLCGAATGTLFICDGARFSPAAARGNRRMCEWLFERGPVVPLPESPLHRLCRGEGLVHIYDLKESEYYR